MEKITRAYDLAEIKKAFLTIEHLGSKTTLSAFRGAQEAGFTRADMIGAIQALENKHFYKSMTSYHDSRMWQDVYRLEYQGRKLYIKFTRTDLDLFLLLSFKVR